MGVGEEARERDLKWPVPVRQFKRWVYERDRGQCGICDLPIVALVDCEIDHIVARSTSGSNEVSNLHATHRVCNQFKLNHSLAWAREHVHAHLRARAANVVHVTIAKLGGISKASHAGDVSPGVLLAWRDAGRIRSALPAARLAAAAERTEAARWRLVARLVGMTD